MPKANPTERWDLGNSEVRGVALIRVKGRLPASHCVRRQLENRSANPEESAHTWPRPHVAQLRTAC